MKVEFFEERLDYNLLTSIAARFGKRLQAWSFESRSREAEVQARLMRHLWVKSVSHPYSGRTIDDR